jgi:hypothetical protein
VDFDSGQLYCADSEFTTKVSMPFCDILGVEHLPGKADAECWAGVFCPRQNDKEYRHDFVLYTKAKRIEFRCHSSAECQKWIRTIQDAIVQHALLLVKEDDGGSSAQSTRTCSRESTLTSDEWDPDSEEQSDFEQSVKLPGRVPASNIAEPGRGFSGILPSRQPQTLSSITWKRPEKPTPDSPGPDVMQLESSDSGLRDRLLARGKGPLPRNIRIP